MSTVSINFTISSILLSSKTGISSTTVAALANKTGLSSLLNTTVARGTLNSSACREKYNNYTCYLAAIIYYIAYIFVALAFLPQIVDIFRYRSRTIMGISYMWIIARILAFIPLIIVHSFQLISFFEMCALLTTLTIFIQIILFADNLHRRLKVILVVVSVVTWSTFTTIMFALRSHTSLLLGIAFTILSVHMLPQILLNSLLRTAKSLSKFAVLFLALSYSLFFASYYVTTDYVGYLISSYYTLTFFWILWLQGIIFPDQYIHQISRSAHTVLTPGIDIYTGLDANPRGYEPQMFSIEDMEPIDGNVVYQPMTSKENLLPETKLTRFVWYSTVGSIFLILVILTVMLIYHVWKVWVIIVPLSIPVVVGLFHIIRTRASVLQLEYLRKIL